MAQTNKPDTEPTQPADHDQILKTLAEAPYISASATELEKAQAEEYGQYVAAEQIYIGTALAFDVGHAVPATHVKLGIVRQDQVKKA